MFPLVVAPPQESTSRPGYDRVQRKEGRDFILIRAWKRERRIFLFLSWNNRLKERDGRLDRSRFRRNEDAFTM